MFKGQNILCISTIDWDFLWQEHQSIMSILARNNRVLFIENTGVRAPGISDMPRIKKRILHWWKSTKGFRKEMENLYVYSPIILPFPYSRFARWINRFLLLRPLKNWMKVMEFYDPIIWTFLPTPIVIDVVEEIPHKAFFYYCTDNFSATSKAARKIISYEQEIAGMADALFVMSPSLAEYFSKLNKNVTCVPMGIDTHKFLNAEITGQLVPEMEAIEGTIIGYIGGIRNSIDQALVAYCAQNMPDTKFVFIGPLQSDVAELKKIENIVFIGQKSHIELPKFIKYFHACIIPYKKDDYTDNISAAKLNEYLIMGKPVISTNLSGVEHFNRENNNIVSVVRSHEEFLEAIKMAVLEDNEGLRKRRKEAALANSWENKVEKMSGIVEAVIKAKEESNRLNWQKSLIMMYKKVRRKTFAAVAMLVFLWFGIFHTPLLWFFASPLEIFNTPQKTDAIVVFGGGVGESGSPGKSTIERARYAMELYKDGYAKKIVFSSGYTYTYNDAENMKLFAISMGVSDGDIILEEHANSTYENVIFSKQILKKNNWNKILLISSPYNMRRVELVFNKFAKEIKVIYTPVKHSQFYDRIEGVKLEQIKAIIHEYLGIIYYLVKGYA